MTVTWNKAKQTLILVAIASAGLAVIIGADRHFRAAAEQSEATELQHALTRTADHIEKNLSNRISAVESLAAFMQYTHARPGLDQFDRFSASLLARHQTIRMFVLVDTDRIIRHIYPMPGNESVIGLDLRRRPAAPFVETAIREKRTTVNHPTRTVQGFLAVVARTPFYRDGRLAGLVGGVFDIAQIVAEAASITSPEIGFELRDATGVRFHGSELSHAYPSTRNVAVGDNHWQLKVRWASAPPGPPSELIGLLWIGGLTLLATVLTLVWRGQTRERWLEAAVAERTRELRTSEERYKLVENAVDDGIWDINLLTQEVYHSPRWKRILGYDDDELPNDKTSFFDRIHPDDRPAARDAIRRHLEENVRYSGELRLRHKDGGYRWVLSRGDAVRDAAGRPIRVVGTITDITERKQAEEALQARKRELIELYRSMNFLREEERRSIARELHDELGQMITALRIDINWLEARLSSAEPAIAGKLSAMNDLVNDTVDSIRRIAEDLRPAMLDSLGLVATLENYSVQFSKRTGIACELTTNEADCRIDDQTATAIFRTVQETLTNVARHANATHVAVCLLCNDDAITLTVRDDGRGLVKGPAAEGLGLRGIRERIAMLNGEFSISSEPGRGVCLDIRIPMPLSKTER